MWYYKKEIDFLNYYCQEQTLIRQIDLYYKTIAV